MLQTVRCTFEELLGIPTLLAIKEGKEVDRIVGVQPKAEIVKRLERLVA